MFRLLLSACLWLGAFFRSRHNLGLELVALRQQVNVLSRKKPRPTLEWWDLLFWLALRRLWSRWAAVLVVVKPDTVVGWHRAGFRLYWRFLSRLAPGRPRITGEIPELIRRMARGNPTRGAPRIHGELLKLGLEISERTVSRYLGFFNSRSDVCNSIYWTATYYRKLGL
jgi:putative transposase